MKIMEKYQFWNENSKSKMLAQHCLECGMLTEFIKFFHVHFTENKDNLIIYSTCFCKTFKNLHTLLLYLFSHAPFKSYFLSCFFFKQIFWIPLNLSHMVVPVGCFLLQRQLFVNVQQTLRSTTITPLHLIQCQRIWNIQG